MIITSVEGQQKQASLRRRRARPCRRGVEVSRPQRRTRGTPSAPPSSSYRLEQRRASSSRRDRHTHTRTHTHAHTHTHTHHHHHHHPIQPIHPRQLRLRVKAVAGPRLVCFVPGKRRLPRADAARSRYCEIIPAAPGPGTREAAFPRHNAIQTCSCSRPDLRYKWSQKLSVKLRINDTFLGCLIIYWRVTKKQWADGTVGLEEWIDDKCSENWARFGINLTVINAMV